MIDTYWSDHCRHTTFGTVLDDVQIEDDAVVAAAFDALSWPCATNWAGTRSPSASWTWAPSARKCAARRRRILTESGRVRGDQRLHREGEGGRATAKTRTGCTCSRTRRTTIPPRSSPSAARPPAWAAPSATPLPGAATCTRPCASPARPIPRCPCRETLPGQAAPAQAGHHGGRRLFAPTATRSAWPPAQVHELYHPGYVAKRMEIGAVVGATPGRPRAPRDARAGRRDRASGRPHRPRRHRRRHRLLQGAQASSPSRPAAPRCRRATRP